VGEISLIVGVVAVAFSFFPVAGELVAAPAAVLAVVLGAVGLGRVDRGVADNPVQAWGGVGMGVLAGLMTLLVFVATSDLVP
jgi:hypothetical protein